METATGPQRSLATPSPASHLQTSRETWGIRSSRAAAEQGSPTSRPHTWESLHQAHSSGCLRGFFTALPNSLVPRLPPGERPRFQLCCWVNLAE